MGLRTLLFLALFLVCSCGALGMPLLGLLGYVAHYTIGPEGQWWSAPLRPYGIRYSYTLAVATAAGVAINYGKLRCGPSLLGPQEKLFLAFLGLLWLLRMVSDPTAGYTVVDHPTVKLTKVALFCLMLSHVATDVRSVRALMWTLVVSAFIVGVQAYNAPRSMFNYGRLEGIGGVDFREANFLPAFIAGVLPLMGIMVLQSRWPGKLLALCAGVFCVNAIVLTRSRGAVVGIGLGALTALALAPKQYRKIIFVGLLVAAAGGLYLSDPTFLNRASTIGRPAEARDRSAQSRLELWQLAVRIAWDHPQGIGPGNYFQAVGRYDPRYEGRDVHSTFMRCLAELGIPGLVLFLGIIAHAVYLSMQNVKRSLSLPLEHHGEVALMSYGFLVGLIMMLGCGITVTLLYTEALWWFLMIPVCLQRAIDNLAADVELASGDELCRHAGDTSDATAYLGTVA